MVEKIEQIPPSSVILLHGCCHNPTGIDPTWEQWIELSDLISRKKLILFFDLAYQGFGINLEQDVAPIRHFVKLGHPCLVASSYSKNFGLYAERLGLLSIVTMDPKAAKLVSSHVKQLIRCNYSTPPVHAARIVTEILNHPDLTKEWSQELAAMRERVIEMRNALVKGLQDEGSPLDFTFMNKQHGIFSYTGLNANQVKRLREEHAIYMPSDGRINVAGLNRHNLKYVIEAILTVIK
jgi:aspartate/tyrosine/aromatic aminotransferase